MSVQNDQIRFINNIFFLFLTNNRSIEYMGTSLNRN